MSAPSIVNKALGGDIRAAQTTLAMQSNHESEDRLSENIEQALNPKQDAKLLVAVQEKILSTESAEVDESIDESNFYQNTEHSDDSDMEGNDNE